MQSLQQREGKDEMTKASIDLQDLRRRIYVKAKAEPSWRFWVIAHPGSSNGSKGDFADSTNWTARSTEAPFALAVLTTERKAA